ncbi:hypothetical protein YN1_1430 [Nanoarchaeota archaeon]
MNNYNNLEDKISNIIKSFFKDNKDYPNEENLENYGININYNINNLNEEDIEKITLYIYSSTFSRLSLYNWGIKVYITPENLNDLINKITSYSFIKSIKEEQFGLEINKSVYKSVSLYEIIISIPFFSSKDYDISPLSYLGFKNNLNNLPKMDILNINKIEFSGNVMGRFSPCLYKDNEKSIEIGACSLDKEIEEAFEKSRLLINFNNNYNTNILAVSKDGLIKLLKEKFDKEYRLDLDEDKKEKDIIILEAEINSKSLEKPIEIPVIVENASFYDKNLLNVIVLAPVYPYTFHISESSILNDFLHNFENRL